MDAPTNITGGLVRRLGTILVVLAVGAGIVTFIAFSMFRVYVPPGYCLVRIAKSGQEPPPGQTLADAGHLDRLLLSTDRCRLSELKVRGGPGYDHLLRSFVPRLRQSGFDEAAIRRMVVENPARILAIDAG